MNGLIEQILDVTEQFPRAKAAPLIAMLLEEQARVNAIVPQIKVTTAPGVESKVTFRPVAAGKRSIDGKLYTVFNLNEAGILIRPHDNGTPLTDDEIRATLDQWNKDAKDTLDGLNG